jgi:O-Antigen ligase
MIDRRALPAEAGLALIGGLFGLSQFIHGGYDEATWSPIALGTLALALALTVAAPRRQPLAALLPLIGLWLWSLLSAGWSDSTDAAHTSAALWLLYAATLGCLWWMVGNDRRRALALLTGASAGVLCVGGWMLVQMLAGDGPALFYRTRLTYPLGYADGQAGFLLLAIWPCLALAERRGSKLVAALAGAGVGGIVVLVALALLSQARSWALGLTAAAVLVLAAIPGRRRRIAAFLLTGATIAALYAPLSDAWSNPNAVTGLPTVARTRNAAVAILIAAVLAAVVWGFAVLLLERLAPVGSPARGRVVRLARLGLRAIGLVAILAVAIDAGAIANRIQSQYDAFVNLAPKPNGLRLFSAGGNRYDYWRVATLEFRSEPIIGVGAGNYEWGYYLHRRTSETITQPHSLELQTLAELGLVGLVALIAFLGAVAAGFRRAARAARTSPEARAVAIAAGGAFAAWLAQTSVDWLHLIPGATAIALAAGAALLARENESIGSLARRPRIAVIVGAAGLALAGAVTIAPRVLSLRAQASAEHALAAGHPRTAIADATRALDYDPSSIPALAIRAAGFARLDAFAPTLADLRRAVAVEPENWATWGLLGDLLARRGDRAGARAAYSRALALDPRELVLHISLGEIASAPK